MLWSWDGSKRSIKLVVSEGIEPCHHIVPGFVSDLCRAERLETSTRQTVIALASLKSLISDMSPVVLVDAVRK